MKIIQKGTSHYILVANEYLAYRNLSVLEVCLMHSLPFLISLEFVTQQYYYTIYKNDGFFIPASWDFHLVPINSTNFHYIWDALFQSM